MERRLGRTVDLYGSSSSNLKEQVANCQMKITKIFMSQSIEFIGMYQELSTKDIPYY